MRILVAGMLAVMLTGCRQGADPGRAVVSADSADQTLVGVRTNLTTEGSRNGLIAADSAFVLQQSQRIDFRRIVVTLNNDEGAQVAVLTAPRAWYDLTTGILKASGGVTVVNPRGDRLSSQRMELDKGKKRFTSDTAYVFQSDGVARFGKELSSDWGLVALRTGRATRAP